VVARNLYVGPPGGRYDTKMSRRHAADLGFPPGQPAAKPITPSIKPKDIPDIASNGFPLWESLDALQLRNYRITLAYGNLSTALARLIAGSDDRQEWDANWCTFATWASKTVGTAIDRRPEEGLLHFLLRELPAPVEPAVFGAAELFLSRGHGAIYRTLAIGNRFVFLEIGTAISKFLEVFDGVEQADASALESYLGGIDTFVAGLADLDPSWMPGVQPDSRTLKAGLRAYYQAMRQRDNPEMRAQYVFLGNLLLAAYEQMRLDTYLNATLSFFTTTWLHRLIRGRAKGYVGFFRRGLAAPLSLAYAELVTRAALVLELPYPEPSNYLKVSRGVPPLDPHRRTRLFPDALERITLPELQALLTRYDLSERDRRKTSVHNWNRYNQRMNYITTLFRSRQQDARLFQAPWSPADTECLLAGKLPPPH
jgi:hypothetical protein